MKTIDMNIEDWFALVGRKRFQREVGRSVQVVTRALSEGKMPASWFIDVRNWCIRNSYDVPEHLFKWTETAPKPSGITQYAYNSGSKQGLDAKQSVSK